MGMLQRFFLRIPLDYMIMVRNSDDVHHRYKKFMDKDTSVRFKRNGKEMLTNFLDVSY